VGTVAEVTAPPWLFRLGKFLSRRRIRGGSFLIRLARQLGLLDRLVHYTITDQTTLDFPLFASNPWDEEDIRGYESDLIGLLAAEAASLPRPVRLIDCGAGVGIVSAMLAERCPFLERILAFEPNGEMATILRRNLERLPMPAQVRIAALSDFTGRGELRSPPYDATEDARYLVPTPAGDIPVSRVDDLEVPAACSLVLKVDTEGAELQVLRGALRTLARVRAFAVAFEANPDVVDRTGVDPLECVRLLQAVRPCRVRVSERPELEVRSEPGFFAQMGERRIYNLVCRSTDSAPPAGAP
jgi:FkbM family methyltransferase